MARNLIYALRKDDFRQGGRLIVQREPGLIDKGERNVHRNIL
jgi:hypothetical protein